MTPAWVIAGVVIVGDCETLDETPAGSSAFARCKRSNRTAKSQQRSTGVLRRGADVAVEGENGLVPVSSLSIAP